MCRRTILGFTVLLKETLTLYLTTKPTNNGLPALPPKLQALIVINCTLIDLIFLLIALMSYVKNFELPLHLKKR